MSSQHAAGAVSSSSCREEHLVRALVTNCNALECAADTSENTDVAWLYSQSLKPAHQLLAGMFERANPLARIPLRGRHTLSKSRPVVER